MKRTPDAGQLSTTDDATLEHASALIADADALVIAAGAGMGVDSGLPDFRGNAGFWKAYPALATAGTSFTDIASPAAFRASPRRAWGFYGHRLALYRHTRPHAGYDILRRWGAAMSNGSFVFTSNVDGHFQAAGFDPLRIDECHGSIHRLQCLGPCSAALWPAATFDPVVDTEHCELLGPLPSCPHCGGAVRPNILMFNDWDWVSERRDLQASRCHSWLERVRSPVVIEIGGWSSNPDRACFCPPRRATTSWFAHSDQSARACHRQPAWYRDCRWGAGNAERD